MNQCTGQERRIIIKQEPELIIPYSLAYNSTEEENETIIEQDPLMIPYIPSCDSTGEKHTISVKQEPELKSPYSPSCSPGGEDQCEEPELIIPNWRSYGPSEGGHETVIEQDPLMIPYSSSCNSWQEDHRINVKQEPELIIPHSPSSSPEFDGPMILCGVCGDKASGIHYGVYSCQGCKAFFRRYLQQKKCRPCPKNLQCSLLGLKRNQCQYCRLKKCIAVGMSLDAVRFGRRTEREKARILAGMQQNNNFKCREKMVAAALEDDARPERTIVGEHLETWHFTRDEVAPMILKAQEQPSFNFSHPTAAICHVCGDKASRFYFGVHSCYGCGIFFRRSVLLKIQYRPCTNNENCSVLRINRNRCKYCRLKKCILVGMSSEAVLKAEFPKGKRLASWQEFNRTPTKSRGKTVAAESEDDARCLRTVVRAHLETGDFTGGEVAPVIQRARK